MLACLNCFDGLFGMHRCDGSHAHGLEAFMLQHSVVVLIKFDAPGLEVLLCPSKLLCIWCEGSDELCTRGAVEEVVCVAGTHAAETRDGDLEAADLGCHFEF